MNGAAALPETFSLLGLQCAVSRDFPALFQSGAWSKPDLVLYFLLFQFPFSFAVSI